MSVGKIRPGKHFLLSQPITLKHSVGYKETGLTVVPSRSSPEAGTCREQHRCGWSGPPLVWESDNKKQMQREILKIGIDTSSSSAGIKALKEAGRVEFHQEK